MKNVFRFELGIGLLLSAAAAGAQSVAPAHPADPAAPVPPAQYDSAFTGYQPPGDGRLAPWREVNDEAARVGGHVGVLRAGEAASSSAPAAPPARPK